MHWIEAAKKAKDLLPADLGYGEKQKALAAVAEKVGLARQSLRNVLAAYDFLESMKADREAYRNLASLPNTSVEIYARWFRYDPEAALEHAARAVLDGLPVKAIIAAEKSAKSAKAPPELPLAGALVTYYREDGHRVVAFKEPIMRHLKALAVEMGPASAWSWDRVADPLSLALGIREAMTFYPEHPQDWRPSPRGKWRHVVGVLEVGERALREGYRKLSKDVMARAIAGTVVYPVVLVVAPNEEALTEMTGALPRPFNKQGGATRPTFFTPAPCIGGILFTSAERARQDLYWVAGDNVSVW